MKIFVLNRGSSSIKCSLFDLQSKSSELESCPLWQAEIEWKNDYENLLLTLKNAKGKKHSETIRHVSAQETLRYVLTFLIEGEMAVLSSLQEIHAVGHRIVHGGTSFTKSTLVTKETKEKISSLAKLAPLHNLPELEGIQILEHLLPGSPQIAVFDTAFHHTLPQKAHIYPLPYSWYEEGIRRFGFHGISFQYCLKRAAKLLNQDVKSLRMIICHLGSGASLCAIKEGISIDTTMGFTPLEGLMMDTRSGSIDPGILLYLLQNKGKSAEEISKALYHESGLLGLSGISSDMRDIIKYRQANHMRSQLAFDIYTHRLQSQIGSMIASLEGLDALIFTAGIGENTAVLREKICKAFSFLGIQLDDELNQKGSADDRILTKPDSKIDVLVVHTKEDFEIAQECTQLIPTK